MINFKNISDSALKRAVDYDEQTPQQSTNSSASIQPAETMHDSFSQRSTVSTDSPVGTNMFNQAQPQGGNGLAGQYASNTGGSNWFGSFGNSSHQSMPNGLAASAISERGRFGVNQTIQAPGQYNVIDGAKLI